MSYVIKQVRTFTNNGNPYVMTSYFKSCSKGLFVHMSGNFEEAKEYEMKSDAQLDFQKYFAGSKTTKIEKL